jgi:hypothetical protein
MIVLLPAVVIDISNPWQYAVTLFACLSGILQKAPH